MSTCLALAAISCRSGGNGRCREGQHLVDNTVSPEVHHHGCLVTKPMGHGQDLVKVVAIKWPDLVQVFTPSATGILEYRHRGWP